MVGASGAIAGVLGAYLVLFPRAMINVFIPLLLFFTVSVPAVVLIGLWFIMQLVSGAATIGVAVGAEGGVAWWAHVGGFASGFLTVWVFRRRERASVQYRQW
jgi:membrane associated rhomboid family serine protease